MPVPHCEGALSATRAQTATGDQIQVVPEPETYALMLLGLAGMGAVVRRRRAQQA
ncbi:MAG: PEP-CTERM sorting domain-containing protein [Rubrivivax sp.]|nr:PEP-CTERM sorting domain-containing protein [Rubrivivax sp.]